jgi:broad-specificity NMP kinase
VIFLQGGPGCGKTTQSVQMCNTLGFEYISVEELIKGYTYKSADEVTKFKGVSVGGRTCSTDHARYGNNYLSS